jgi:phosphatidylinositol-3-phosphatase
VCSGTVVLGLAAVALSVLGGAASAGSRVDPLPPVGHVFVVNIENKDYAKTWGPDSPAPYLAQKLRSKGVLIDNYYGTAHHSLGNYLAQISGQAPNPAIQADCGVFRDWDGSTVPDGDGQYAGSGCVFPRETPTLAGQLDEAGYSWRGYMEDMGRGCRHPKLDGKDHMMKAEVDDQYATRHNPFMYFHSIIDRPKYCKSHVVDLSVLEQDLGRVATTRNLTYITPDLCHDGHDSTCADGGPGGLRGVNAWMREWIPRILASPAYQQDGVLIVTADESDGVDSDSSACCGEVPGPNANGTPPGIEGPGGGRIGALVLSKQWVEPGTVSTTPYNHYSLLRSIEDLFGLAHLGFAAQDGLVAFGSDVFNDYRP